MLLDDTIYITLDSKSISYYENKGYDLDSLKVLKNNIKRISRGTKLCVNISDLPDNSITLLNVKCDYCGKEIKKQYREYLNSNKNGIIHKDCCNDNECLVKKRNESNIKIYGCENVFQNDDIKNNIKLINMQRYGVEHYSQTEDFIIKHKKTMLSNYGVEHASQNLKIKEKTIETNKLKYGANYYSQTDEFKEKIVTTCLAKYGVSHVMKVDEIKNRGIMNSIKSRYLHGTTPTSKQQEYLHVLLGGELNYPVGNCMLDIAFQKEKIYVEYDGSGHDLRVKLGDLTQEEFDKKEINRYYFLKKNGWKLIRFVSNNDYIPNENIIINVFNTSKQYLQLGHSWIKFDFENNYLECSEYKQIVDL